MAKSRTCGNSFSNQITITVSLCVHKLAVSPELLVTGHAGEILVKAMESKLAGQGTYNDSVS